MVGGSFHRWVKDAISARLHAHPLLLNVRPSLPCLTIPIKKTRRFRVWSHLIQMPASVHLAEFKKASRVACGLVGRDVWLLRAGVTGCAIAIRCTGCATGMARGASICAGPGSADGPAAANCVSGAGAEG